MLLLSVAFKKALAAECSDLEECLQDVTQYQPEQDAADELEKITTILYQLLFLHSCCYGMIYFEGFVEHP